MSIEDSGPQVHGQFVRIQTYAREASKKAIQLAEAKAKATSKPVKKVWSSSDVLAEALRDPGACGHVMNPEPPTFHFGTEKRLRGLVAELDGYADAIKARTGKRPRKDTAHMLAGVLSYPDDAPKDRYPEWRERSLKWLHKRYGQHLVAVIEHQDEANPHLHFYAIEPEGLDVKRIHEGWQAKHDGQDYRDAMRLVQDDYHRDVSAYVGLLRIGPGGKRLEREDYMAMKADAEQTRTMLHDIEARSEKIEETLTAAQGVGLQAQQMGVLMLQKAKSRAETIEANARVHAQIVKDETRRIHDEKIRLTEWADTLEKSAKKIAANTAHMVEIVVPKEPQPARIQVAPQANERPKDATPWTGGTPGPGSW